MIPRTTSLLKNGSESRFVSYDLPVVSMSTHGDISSAAAGSGSPSSLARNCTVTASQPPTESPANAMRPALIP